MVLIYNTARHGLLRLILVLFIYVGFYAQHAALAAEEPTSSNNNNSSIIETVSGDYKSFYAGDRLIRMGIVFGAAGIAANTNIDMSIRNWYQDNVRSSRTDAWSSSSRNVSSDLTAKFFGEGKYMVPVALLAASVNSISTDTAIGNWGANASRAYIVGLPAMWFTQGALGATRPGDRPEGSSWGTPFSASNGVSGHAFVGAVPFLTIAYMNPDNKFVKYTAYVASAATTWSRINDDAHFPSQALLGWYMGWEAVDAVFENNQKKKSVTVAPMAGLDGFGLMASGSW
jgi:membrane-associated phospholipid phosphatase